MATHSFRSLRFLFHSLRFLFLSLPLCCLLLCIKVDLHNPSLDSLDKTVKTKHDYPPTQSSFQASPMQAYYLLVCSMVLVISFEAPWVQDTKSHKRVKNDIRHRISNEMKSSIKIYSPNHILEHSGYLLSFDTSTNSSLAFWTFNSFSIQREKARMWLLRFSGGEGCKLRGVESFGALYVLL